MEHLVKTIGGLTVNLDTLITMWSVMAVLIILAFVSTRKMSIFPTKMQAVAESIVGMFVNLTESMIGGKDAKKHVPLAASLFLFIVTANLCGQLPLRLFHLSKGELASPTNDINLTAAMAVIVLVYYVAAGIKKKKFKFFLHEFSFVGIVMALVELLEMFTRPLSLAIRLFANIFAGEVLVSIALGVTAYLLPLPIMLFEILVAFIQATVFMMLTIAYIGSAAGESH
ncbi:MAG: F0F1 ATP synthase subunit A [Candidatus Gastranaerophilaceae bacterium]